MVVVDMGRSLWRKMESLVVELGCEYAGSVMYVELIVVIPDFIGRGGVKRALAMTVCLEKRAKW